MSILTATADQITDIEVRENTDIEFVFNGRLYQLEIGLEEWDALPYPIKGNEFEEFKSFKNIDFLQVAHSLRLYAKDITEYCDKGLAMLRKQARKQLLSFVVSSANKLRSALKSMSLAMHTAWTKAKILATGVVQFIKMQDVDIEGEIPVQTRRVASLESFGIKYDSISKDLLRFIDLDKIAKGLSPVSCIISMRVWQVVGWSEKSIG